MRYVVARYEDDEPDYQPVTQLEPAAQLSAWLAAEHLSCCTLQGGFLILADGAPWNRDAIDEISMSTTWLGAVERLLAGAASQGVWAWEESNMTLVRRGEDVEMYDVHHAGSVVCPLVRFPLRDFALALAEAAEQAGTFLGAVLALDMPEAAREVLQANLAHDWAEAAARVRAAAQGPLPEPEGEAPSALHLAIRLDDREALQRALAEEGPNVREADQPALCEAMQLRRLGAVEALLAAGADPNALDRHGIHALTCAVRSGEEPIVAALLKAGADTSGHPGWRQNPVRAAAQSTMYHERPSPILARLLAAGARIDLPSAILLGDHAGARRLAHEAPAHPDILGVWAQRLRQETLPGRQGSPAERIAAWTPALQALREAGAPLHYTEGEADPPLHAAVLSESLELVEAVLALGADPRAPGRMGQSALERAERYGLEAIAARLREG